MSYETAFNTDDYSDDAIEMVGNQNRFHALLENHPMIILPVYCWEDKTDEQARKMAGFLFSLFNHNGIVTTDAAGVSLDPSMLGHSRNGLYKHSKMRKTDFLILTDVHGESDFALMRLALMAAVDCKLPFIAHVHGKGFEATVDILTPPTDPDNSGDGWETEKSAPLLNMILQSRYSASPSPLLDVPFAIECVYETHDTEKKLYKLTADTELLAFDTGNHRYTHWEDYSVRGY
jgi:hypothetical protein